MLRLEQSAEAMGSAYSIAVYGYDRDQMEAAVEAAFDEVRQLDSMLSNYKPDSEWSEVNREAARHPVHVSPELFQLLAACQEYSRQSEGAFDISVGPLMKVWGFYKGTGHLPHRAEVHGRHAARRLPARASRRRPTRPCASTGRAWNSIPAASAKATPWTAWWTC